MSLANPKLKLSKDEFEEISEKIRNAFSTSKAFSTHQI